MTALPPVPPITDNDRYQTYTISSSTSYLDLSYPLFGDATDIVVYKNDEVFTEWTFSSIAGGSAISTLPRPIEDGRITFNIAQTSGTFEVVYKSTPTFTPVLGSLTRREYNQDQAKQYAILRELRRESDIGSDARDEAVAAAAAAALSLDSFDDRYLGAKASDPALDNDGDALITGAVYFNTASNELRVWNGSAWTAANTNTYVDAIGSAGSDEYLTLAANTVIPGKLKITVPAGVTRNRVLGIGAGCKIGSIEIVSVDQQANTGHSLHGAVRVTGDNVEIGSISVTNFDNAVVVYDVDNCNISKTTIDSYVRGLFIRDVTNSDFGNGLVKTASANASNSAGHNGILIDAVAADRATAGLKFGRWNIRNAGEHGFRIGGAGVITSNVSVSELTAQLCGASCVKILGSSGKQHEFINIAVLKSIDNGTSDENGNGLQVAFVKNSTFGDILVTSQANARSAYHGIRFGGLNTVTFRNVMAYDASNHGFYFDPDFGGDIDDVRIEGGIFQGNGGDGIHIDYTGRNVRRLVVAGYPTFVSNAGYGINSTNTSGGAVTRGFITGFSFFNTTGEIAGPLMAGVLCDINLDAAPTFSAANGSTARDHAGTAYTRSGGSWVANV